MKNGVKIIFGGLMLAGTVSAVAHPHRIITPKGDDVYLGGNSRNSQDLPNHPAFKAGTSCESFGVAGGTGTIAKSWYGLETAHHGPDAGTKGKGDGCYQTTGNKPPSQDVQSPVIK